MGYTLAFKYYLIVAAQRALLELCNAGILQTDLHEAADNLRMALEKEQIRLSQELN